MRCSKPGHRASLARRVVVSSVLLSVAGTAWAQTAPKATDLPPVTVEAAPPKPAKTIKKAKKAKAVTPSVASAPTPAQASPSPSTGKETGTSPVKGFVAGVSATATKTDTPLLETPQAVSVVTRDQMDQQAAQSVKQALQYTSGVAADTRTAFAGYDIVYSRGFALDRYLDGLKVLGGATAFTTPQIELYGLERLEVLHGPASMLYGSSSPGGIVNAISKRPTDEPFHELQFQFGNFDHVEAAFDFSGPITSDKHWLYRLSGLASSTDSQVDFNEKERYWIAPSLTYQDSSTTLTLLASVQHDPNVGLYNVVPAVGTVLPSPNGTIPRSRFLGEPGLNVNKADQESVGYALQHRFDETWTVRQNLRYMHTDGVVQQLLPLSTPGLVDTTLSRYALGQWADIKAFTVDTNVEAKFRTGFLTHKLMVGVDYQHLDEETTITQDLGSDIDVYNPVYGDTSTFIAFRDSSDQRLAQTGIYVQDQIGLDRLSVTLGARKDFSKVKNDAASQDWLFGDGSVIPSQQEQEDDAVTGRVGVTYRLDGGIVPYASYSTSFQPTLSSPGSALFKPKTAEQYEVGIKYQPIGYNALFTVAAYDLTQQNVPTTSDVIPIVTRQIGEVRSRGIEFEGKASLNDNLDLIGSYTRSETEVTESLDSQEVGKRPVNIPDQVASLWAFYTFREGSLDGFGFGGGVRYVGDTAGDTYNTFFVPQYTVYDAAAKYDLGKLAPVLRGTDLQLNVTNLFDKTYVSECSNELNCAYGNGRTIITTLKYRW